MGELILTVRAPERSWAALLRLLPRCTACEAAAEVRVSADPLCLSCAAARRCGRLTVLPQGDAVAAIEAALLPHEAALH